MRQLKSNSRLRGEKCVIFLSLTIIGGRALVDTRRLVKNGGCLFLKAVDIL
jgi:hypothetical protein